VMRMKAVNRKPVIRPEGTLALQGGEEVRDLPMHLEVKR
jgi:putative transposase